MEPRDPNRISEVLQEIQRVWEKHPDLRLGQLLLNYLHPAVECPKLYGMEDDVLLRHLGIKNPPNIRRPVVDLSTVKSESDIHEIFADTFNFPDFYGSNWDAFWDILTGFGCFPSRFAIHGTEHLRHTFPSALKQLEKCFEDCRSEMKEGAPNVVWR